MDEDTQAPVTDAPLVDTADEQASKASNPINNDAPDTNQEEETGVNGEDTAEEKLYAGKYKTVEDMEKAYKELQTKATKDAMQKAELAKSVNTALDEQVDYGDSSDVQIKLDRLERNDAISRFVMSHPDADTNEVTDILTSDPVISSINSYDGRLEYAYLKSKNMASQKAVEEASKKAAVQKEAKILEKQAAQVESSRKAEPEQQADLLTQATTGSAEEREAARRALIRKHLINL